MITSEQAKEAVEKYINQTPEERDDEMFGIINGKQHISDSQLVLGMLLKAQDQIKNLKP